MEIKELKIGEYYHSGYLSYNMKWIFKAEVFDKSSCKGICIDENKFIVGYVFCNKSAFKDLKDLRLATPLERQWLDLCITNNKFMPIEELELLNSVEIY